MWTYIILILILTSFVILSYFLFKRDVLSPSFLSCLVFLCSAILGTIGLSSWNNVDSISIKLVCIISVGLLVFIVGEYLLRRFINKDNESINLNNKYIEVGKIKYVLTLIFIVVTIILLIVEIKKVCNYYDYTGSLPEMLNFYRMKTLLYNTENPVDIDFIVKQMQKACEIICIYYIFIFLNNFFIQKYKKNVLLMIPILLCMAQSLLTTGRVVLMRFIVFAIYVFLVHYIRYNENKPDLWKKILKIGAIGTVGAVSVFYLMIPLLGREKNTEPIKYISFYIGTSIPSFEYTLDNPTEENDYWGRETFAGLYNSLDKLGILNIPEDKGYVWINFIGYRSNVYTSLRAYYNDFGILGVIICQIISGFVFSWLYMKSKSNKLFFIWYSNYVYILVEQVRAEQFFRLLSINCLIYTILIIFFYKFFNVDTKKTINLIDERKIKDE